jgi:hypothetical protein
MEGKKQTAVEFAFEELNKWRVENFGIDALIGIPQEILDKAKQMEREQIIDAHLKGQREDIDFINEAKEEAKQYFNETYGKDKSET